MTDQATQIDYSGIRIYRWYVTIDRPRHRTIVTWAETADIARAKVAKRGFPIVSIVPAISAFDDAMKGRTK